MPQGGRKVSSRGRHGPPGGASWRRRADRLRAACRRGQTDGSRALPRGPSDRAAPAPALPPRSRSLRRHAPGRKVPLPASRVVRRATWACRCSGQTARRHPAHRRACRPARPADGAHTRPRRKNAATTADAMCSSATVARCAESSAMPRIHEYRASASPYRPNSMSAFPSWRAARTSRPMSSSRFASSRAFSATRSASA